MRNSIEIDDDEDDDAGNASPVEAKKKEITFDDNVKERNLIKVLRIKKCLINIICKLVE